MLTGLHPRCPLPPTLTLPLGGGSCEKIPLTPALSPAFGGEGKGEGAI